MIWNGATGPLDPGTRPEPFPIEDARSRFRPTDPSTIIHELSTELQGILQPDSDHLSETLVDLLADSEVLHDAPWAASVMVFRITKGIVAKLSPHDAAMTEYSSLQYLSEHLPQFPCPRPHGLIRFGPHLVLFMTFVPGMNLEKAWPELDDTQKRSVSSQLDTLLLQLRSLSWSHVREIVPSVAFKERDVKIHDVTPESIPTPL